MKSDHLCVAPNKYKHRVTVGMIHLSLGKDFDYLIQTFAWHVSPFFQQAPFFKRKKTDMSKHPVCITQASAQVDTLQLLRQ